MTNTQFNESTWFWSPYTHWARRLKKNRLESIKSFVQDAPVNFVDYVPVFVRFNLIEFKRKSGIEIKDSFDLNNVFQWTINQDLPEQEGNDLVGYLATLNATIEPHELESTDSQIAGNPDAVEFYVYIPLAIVENLENGFKINENDEVVFSDVFQILDVGSTVAISLPVERFIPGDGIPKNFSNDPIICVIDDGIGFLNSRFTTYNNETESYQTRFEAFWMQAREVSDDSTHSVRLGASFMRDDIDKKLTNKTADGRSKKSDELAEYQEINKQLLHANEHRSTEYAFSHGTHVLDLAAGADPYETATEEEKIVRNWDLMAVQLPPESVADTSGTLFETHIVMAVRWLLLTVRNRSTRPTRPVIINISMGMLAGPKNGTRFLEYQVARELEKYGESASVVYAYGNNYRSNQVANFKGLGSTQQEIEWVVQPDDFTASFIEIYNETDGMNDVTDDIKISLIAPNGQIAFDFASVPVNQFVDAKNGINARIYRVAERDLDTNISTRGHFVIAIAPTASEFINDPLLQNGSWKLKIRNDGTSPVDLNLQIQRGDTAPGFETKGRQSYFDHEDAYEWDTEIGDYSDPIKSPISRHGTLSALATVHKSKQGLRGSQIHTVGAALSENGKIQPTRYTSRAGRLKPEQKPSFSAIVEDGFFQSGTIASGTFSGTTQELNGTSAAAPQVTRHLAHIAQGTDFNTIISSGGETPGELAIDPKFSEQLGGKLVKRSAPRNRRLGAQ